MSGMTWESVLHPTECSHDWTPWRPAGDGETRWCRTCTEGRFHLNPVVVLAEAGE